MTTQNTAAAPAQTQALTPFQARAMELRENIAASEPTALVPRTFAEAQAFASALATSDLVPKALRDNAPNTLMMILAGAELGVAPIASMRIFHVIEGVPKLSADGIAALCLKSPLCEYLEPRVQTNERVVWATKRRDRPSEVVLEVTQVDIERANLHKSRSSGAASNHVLYPRAMKNARCKAELCRLVFPEICAGMLSAEEARDSDAIDAEFTEVKSSGFGPLPTNTNAPKVETKTEHAPTNADHATEQPEPTALADTGDSQDHGPLNDDDVALLAEDMKRAGDEKDAKELSSIAADIAKLGTDKRINEAQRRYLLGVHKKANDAIKGAKP